ncbi:hypothetical protein JOD31_003054 [Methylopila capsulata]|uniref:Uncharacterized protein n=1 Tax=Methylopila capsulata TaxID=61654 RepID=A0A9W6IXP8_9HYPH|nr:hypothetical protein [Methylopila capsulata]MBM7852812.1 hypothetical protein [Methylopila capsulata]GLK57021.1 hypothetical protein GCM10008170_30400 [Methylopila capsulata]
MPDASAGSLDVKRVVTLAGATVLIATQTIAASVAGGWAIAGFFGLGEIGAYALEAAGLAVGVWIVVKFVRAALKQEPLRTQG